ncbi:MAG: LuxR C-terminal-related transcriptional regulator [Actinomycetota bacterium]
MLRATRVVGRQGELQLLANATGTVVLAGGAGMGKSTLVRQAASDPSEATGGRATPPPAPALRPLAELALALIRAGGHLLDPRLALHGNALSVLLPGMVGGPGDAEPVSPLQVADAVLRLRDSIGRKAPSLLVLEDLHWADHQTAAVVESLADALHGSTVTLLCTLRPEGPVWPAVRRLVQRHVASLIELGPLADAEVRDLVSACLGADPPGRLMEAVAVAGGVPLFVEELLTAYEQRGELCRQNGRWTFRPGRAALPPSVGENVAARLRELDGDVRVVVEAAALLGQEFDATLLAAAIAGGAEAVDDALLAAVPLGLLAPGETGPLRFAHALVREAVLAAATGARLQPIALRLLAALEARPPSDGDLELAAALATSGGQHERAAAFLDRAGRRHLDRGYPAAAVECIDQAFALSPPTATSLERREALLEALALAGDAERARSEGELVRRQLATAGASAARRRACTVAMARAAANAGRWTEAAALLAEVPGAASSLEALVAFELGRFEEADASARRAAADGSAPPSAVCEASEVLGRLGRRRDLDEAAFWFSRAAATAELHDLALWRARAHHELATIDQLRTLSISGLEDARQAAIAASAPGLLSAVEFHLAAVHGVRFEPEAALAAARRCLDTARRLGASRQEAWAWNLIGQAHAVAGDRIRATAAAAEALTLAGDDPEVIGVAVGTARGLASLIVEDRDRAIAEWREAIAALRRLPGPTPLPPWYLWPLLSTCLDLEGDGGARARAETDTADLRLATGPDGLWHMAEAVARGRAGDAPAAQAALDRAGACFRLVPAFAGYVHLGRRLAAEAALDQGWGQPAEWLVEAAAWFGERGLVTAAGACRSLARRAGVPERRAGRGASAVPAHLTAMGVTSREVDVLRLLAEGLTNRVIAERLYVSPRTVKGHIESLLAKTGASNRTQLATLAVRPRA